MKQFKQLVKYIQGQPPKKLYKMVLLCLEGLWLAFYNLFVMLFQLNNLVSMALATILLSLVIAHMMALAATRSGDDFDRLED